MRNQIQRSISASDLATRHTMAGKLDQTGQTMPSTKMFGDSETYKGLIFPGKLVGRVPTHAAGFDHFGFGSGRRVVIEGWWCGSGGMWNDTSHSKWGTSTMCTALELGDRPNFNPLSGSCDVTAEVLQNRHTKSSWEGRDRANAQFAFRRDDAPGVPMAGYLVVCTRVSGITTSPSGRRRKALSQEHYLVT